jgi:hypothetical protein
MRSLRSQATLQGSVTVKSSFGKTDAEKTAQANAERVRFPQIPACKYGLYRREDSRRFGDR